MKPSEIDASRMLLRHIVATLTYRAAKVLRDVPAYGVAVGVPATVTVRDAPHQEGQ